MTKKRLEKKKGAWRLRIQGNRTLPGLTAESDGNRAGLSLLSDIMRKLVKTRAQSYGSNCVPSTLKAKVLPPRTSG